MQFAQPQNLWSLLVLLPMVGAYVFWWMWKHRLMERIGERDLLMAMAATRSARRQVARAVFVLLGTALLCIAVAQPQWGQTNRAIKRTGVDVVFALDLSASMGARDVAPSRLEAAKNEIETTLEVLRGDRVGLVVFTAVSFVQTPLTTDYGAIRFYLDRLKPGQMPLGGTSLGRAVVDSVELLTGKRVAESEQANVEMRRAKNQIVVLITDGEDHESDPRSASQLAQTNDIKIVTVGFGSAEGERIPVLRPDGSLAGYKRDREGNVVRTSLDDETLKQMADATGGRYIHYAGENSVANDLVNYINALEKSEVETMLKERYRERYAFFAVPGLLLLILSLLLGERKPKNRRKSDAAKVALVGLVASIALFGSGCERAFEDTLGSVDEGNEYIEAGEYEKALEQYRRAEAQIPARPELHYDIGRALLGLERWDEAADAFARALETDDLSLRFDSLFNLALAHAGKESWREAWETYRDALALAAKNPGVIDEARKAEARWNLEVAWRRFYPPCSKLEDAHEDNDEPGTATKLEENKVDKATLCGLDDDYYVVGAIPGTHVSLRATFRELRDEPDEEQAYLPNAADLQIAIFDQTGDNVLVVDQGDPAAPTSGPPTERTIDRFLVEEGMVSGEMPHVLVKVTAAEHLEFEYDLEIESIPPCHALEDEFEDNDGPDESKLLQPGNHNLHYCGADEDWFAVQTELGDSFFIDVQRPPDAERERPAALGFEIYDANGRVVATGEEEGAFLTAGVRDITRPGRYMVRVFGQTDDEQGPYQLDLYNYAPCIVGDDRFEENDTANAASQLDQTQPVHRYLRACDADPDYYRIDFTEDQKPEDRKVEMGLARVSTPAPGADPTEAPNFEFDLVSRSGDQILVPGYKPELPENAEEPSVPIALLVQKEEIEEDAAILRVTGENEFYHLVQLNVQNPEQDQQDQQDQQEEQDQQESDDESSDSEEQEDSSSGEEDEQSEEQDEGGDSEEERDEEGEEEQPEPQSGEEEPPPEEGESAEQQLSPEEVEEGRLEDILKALEQTDDNFQMRKALENIPGRYIEKDW